MYDKKQNIHYCTILSAEQWDFLLEGKFSTHRQKCLYKLLTDAVQVETSYKIKGVEIVLEVGEVAASDVELAEYLGCNRKTIGKLVDCFNRLGMLTTRTNNRTSIHTLHFLTGWYVGGVMKKRRRTARMVIKTINIDANDRRTQKAEFKAVLRCRGVTDRACPDIAHYNYTLRFRSCGLSRGAGRCPVPLRTLP